MAENLKISSVPKIKKKGKLKLHLCLLLWILEEIFEFLLLWFIRKFVLEIIYSINERIARYIGVSTEKKIDFNICVKKYLNLIFVLTVKLIFEQPFV